MMYLCILILCVVSVTGRITVNVHKDDVNNSIVNTKPDENKQNNNSIPTERDDIHHNLIVEPDRPKISWQFNTADCIIMIDRICILKPKSIGVRVDNGTALLLTKYIKESKIKEAQRACKVDSKHFLGIKSYSGFFTVNETYNSNVFFWYFPVLNKSVSEAPLMIWLQGGPGATSLIGLFDEIGPFTVKTDILEPNPNTWLRDHSLLFIDNPVGTGYSFTDHVDGYVTDMATYGAHLYSTLSQFLQVFPELRTAPLYIAGESYAGKYVPAMAMEIHKRIQEGENVGINLQGLIIGNAYVDPDMISHTEMPFYNFGLLEKEQIDLVKPLIDSFHRDIKANKSIEAKQKWNTLIVLLISLANQKHAYNFLRDDPPIGSFRTLLKKSEIKRALHVGDIDFTFVNVTVNTKLAADFLSTAKPIFETLLEHYKVLAYCGQLDQMLPCVFTSENYRTWKWNGTEEFLNATRFPYYYNRKLAGYHKSGGHLTEVVIRGAGHMAAADTPAPVQTLVTKWTHGEPLSSMRSGLMMNATFIRELVANNSIAYFV